MTEPTSSSPFINSSNKGMYGKIPLQSWVGKVVSYDQQKDQLDEGWGWRYKVRILGDNSNVDLVKEDELSYALCLLPTTAGSGAAHKLRSVRISQGDMVFGFVGGDGPRYIIGVFPRTSKSPTSSGKFGTLSGFYGSLEDRGILKGAVGGEFNEQIGPETPSTDPVGPKNYSKAEKKEPSDKAKEIGAVSGDENINVEEILTPKKLFLSLKDYAQNLLKGKNAVNSKENLDRITDEVIEKEDRTQEDIEIAKTAIKVSKEQNLIEETVAREKENKINKLEVVNVNNQGIILNSEAVRDGLLTYVDGNGKQFVKFTSPSGKVTFEPADKVRKSSAKTKAYIDRIENEETTYEISSTGSESTETSTTSSSSDVTYNESTNTFTRSSRTTTRETTSTLVKGSEAPKTVTDIKAKLFQNEREVNRYIKMYQTIAARNDKNRKSALGKIEIAQRQLRELKTIDPTTYDGSSLQTELKSSYIGIMY